MCEPHVSITQFPTNDPESGDPLELRLKAVLGEKVMSWKKRLGSWFHWCRVGSGHSESMELHYGRELRIPEMIKYEAKWWEKDVFFVDGIVPSTYKGLELEAFGLAEHYSKEVATKNMSVLRRFIENSMKKSETPFAYAEKLLSMMTPSGAASARVKLRRVFGLGQQTPSSLARWSHDNSNTFDLFKVRNPGLEKAVSCLMGFTRKRDLFLPEWADDQSLWKPGQ